MNSIRVGIIGLGNNTRLRHVPGLRACRDVEIAAVCNRSEESTARAAQEFGIPHTFPTWQELVASPNIDAIVIGTWPYLHCEITMAALRAGKHVLTEARMARNATEARQMLAASREHADRVVQIVPSPFGLRIGAVVRELVDRDYLGELREIIVLGTNNTLASPESPWHWRQSAELSGMNMLVLGILHETLLRWTPDPVRVLAQTQIFTPMRRDPSQKSMQPVETPDSVHVLTQLPNGARGIYHLSGAIHFGPPNQIHLYGSQGTLKCMFQPEEKLFGALMGESELKEIAIPNDKSGGWRVEAEFIEAIRDGRPVSLTDFATGVRYMEFTEAVSLSARTGSSVQLPLS